MSNAALDWFIPAAAVTGSLALIALVELVLELIA